MLLSSFFFRVSLQHTQSQDGEGAKPKNPADGTDVRRRGDRIGRSCCACSGRFWHTFAVEGGATTWSAILGYNRRTERVDAMPVHDPRAALAHLGSLQCIKPTWCALRAAVSLPTSPRFVCSRARQSRARTAARAWTVTYGDRPIDDKSVTKE